MEGETASGRRLGVELKALAVGARFCCCLGAVPRCEDFFRRFSWQVPPALSQAGSRALDLLFPRSCVQCEEPVEEESPFRFICEACARLLTIVRPPACRTCGFPFFGALAGERVCPHCQELEPLFGEARTAVLMKGPARTLVHELKYHGQVHLLRDMGTIFTSSEGLIGFVRGGVLVPVPLHARKRRERGFNQSLLLAEKLQSLSGGESEVWDGLMRSRDTESQTHFDRKRRQRNLKNAFALRKKCPLNPALRFILVDDVFTTGSTLNACAAALRRGGARHIDVITFGHG
jgi:competence protein ComFC